MTGLWLDAGGSSFLSWLQSPWLPASHAYLSWLALPLGAGRGQCCASFLLCCHSIQRLPRALSSFLWCFHSPPRPPAESLLLQITQHNVLHFRKKCVPQIESSPGPFFVTKASAGLSFGNPSINDYVIIRKNLLSWQAMAKLLLLAQNSGTKKQHLLEQQGFFFFIQLE